MAHRIREAMRPGKNDGPMGGPGKVVEVDETLIGGKEKNKHVSKRNPKNIGSMGKECAFSLVERGGRVRSFHVKSVSAKNLGPILFAQVDRASTLMSDDAGQRSEEHTSELQSLMRISYAVFCLKKKKR